MNELRERLCIILNDVTHDSTKSKIIEQSAFDFVNTYTQLHPHLSANVINKMYVKTITQIYFRLHPNSYVKCENSKMLQDAQKMKSIAQSDFKAFCPQKWLLMQSDLDLLDKTIMAEENIYTTDTFQCHNCLKNKCIYSEVQIRACDENTTIFVRCLNCGHCFHG